MDCTMGCRSFLRTLCTLPILVAVALSHMQMEEPSPLRDPHSNRASEPKDYNILTPLHSGGDDFACKGYQWNTPLESVATYHAGETYELKLRGGATHGGGSCQISLSCNNGINFKVIKSIVGGCPIQKVYKFTIPVYAKTSKKCLMGWSWFNKVGNREMYMNCAVVDIIGKEDSRKKRSLNDDYEWVYEDEDYTSTYDEGPLDAQAALARLPDMYVANLKGINDCTTSESVDAIFDDPGNDVVYSKDISPWALRPRGKSINCTGVGRKSSAESSSLSSSSASSYFSSKSAGDNGQWHDYDHFDGSNKPSKCNDGYWHIECYSKLEDDSESAPLKEDTSNFEELAPEDTYTYDKLVSEDPYTNDEPAYKNSSAYDTPIIGEYISVYDERPSEEAHSAYYEAASEEGSTTSTESSDVKLTGEHYSSLEAAANNESLDDASELKDYHPKHACKKEAHKKQKPAGSYSADDSKEYFVRQFRTRQVSEDLEESTAIPYVDFEAPPREDDLYDGFKVALDETTMYMVIKQALSTITTPLPTESAIFGEEGYLLVEPDTSATSGNNIFLVLGPHVELSMSAASSEGGASQTLSKFGLPIETGAIGYGPSLDQERDSDLPIAIGLGESGPIEYVESLNQEEPTELPIETGIKILDDSSSQQLEPQDEVPQYGSSPEEVAQQEATPEELGYGSPQGYAFSMDVSQSNPILEDTPELSEESRQYGESIPFPAPESDVNHGLISSLRELFPFLQTKPSGVPSTSESTELVVSDEDPLVPWQAEDFLPYYEEDALPEVCTDNMSACASCESPNRCLKVNNCMYACTRRPHYYKIKSTSVASNWILKQPLSPSSSIIAPSTATVMSWLPNNFMSSSTATNIPAAQSAPPFPANATTALNALHTQPASTPTAVRADGCPTSQLPYATGDPNDFLPCNPGSMLCKSPTEFYTCGQFGVDGSWSYGALQPVSGGMLCKPKLSLQPIKRSVGKTQEFVSEDAEEGNIPELFKGEDREFEALDEGEPVDVHMKQDWYTEHFGGQSLHFEPDTSFPDYGREEDALVAEDASPRDMNAAKAIYYPVMDNVGVNWPNAAEPEVYERLGLDTLGRKKPSRKGTLGDEGLELDHLSLFPEFVGIEAENAVTAPEVNIGVGASSHAATGKVWGKRQAKKIPATTGYFAANPARARPGGVEHLGGVPGGFAPSSGPFETNPPKFSFFNGVAPSFYPSAGGISGDNGGEGLHFAPELFWPELAPDYVQLEDELREPEAEEDHQYYDSKDEYEEVDDSEQTVASSEDEEGVSSSSEPSIVEAVSLTNEPAPTDAPAEEIVSSVEELAPADDPTEEAASLTESVPAGAPTEEDASDTLDPASVDPEELPTDDPGTWETTEPTSEEANPANSADSENQTINKRQDFHTISLGVSDDDAFAFDPDLESSFDDWVPPSQEEPWQYEEETADADAGALEESAEDKKEAEVDLGLTKDSASNVTLSAVEASSTTLRNDALKVLIEEVDIFEPEFSKSSEDFDVVFVDPALTIANPREEITVDDYLYNETEFIPADLDGLDLSGINFTTDLPEDSDDQENETLDLASDGFPTPTTTDSVDPSELTFIMEGPGPVIPSNFSIEGLETTMATLFETVASTFATVTLMTTTDAPLNPEFEGIELGTDKSDFGLGNSEDSVDAIAAEGFTWPSASAVDSTTDFSFDSITVWSAEPTTFSTVFGKRVMKRQDCPLVPVGYYRDDQYVLQA